MRWVWSIAIVLLAGVPHSRAQVGGAAADSGREADDRAQLIEGVRQIGYRRSTRFPGGVCAQGQRGRGRQGWWRE